MILQVGSACAKAILVVSTTQLSYKANKHYVRVNE